MSREMCRVIDAAQEKNICIRAVGGVAIRFKSNRPVIEREYDDVDFIVEPIEYSKLKAFFEGIEYFPDKRFNLLNDAGRQIYYYRDTDKHIDVFVGDFEMCHKLPMKNRLHLDPVTVPLADLLLTKAQVVKLNRKDALDIASLLLSNELGNDDRDKLNVSYIAHLCGSDWGWCKTLSINLERIKELLNTEDLNLKDEDRGLILSRVSEIELAIASAPKSLAWQLRDRVGTRVRWYAEVEEVEQ